MRKFQLRSNKILFKIDNLAQLKHLKKTLSFSLNSVVQERGVRTYNPYSSGLYRVKTVGSEKSFEPIVGGRKKYSKSSKILSFLSNSDFVFETLEINKNIPDDEVEEAIYNIVYEELDNSIEYHIVFDEIKKRGDDNQSEYREFNIFIVEPNILKYLSSTINHSIKYIDRLYPIPLLFKSLYKYSEEYERVECFVYIHRDGTSFNLFVHGELLYSKALNFSTIIFFEYFKEYFDGKNILYTDFQKIITNEERLFENAKNRRALTKSLQHFFEEISDVINYIKRSFNIEVIDNIYYSSKFGKILGMADYSEALIGEHSFDSFLSEFSIPFPDNIDEIHYLLYLTYQLKKEKNIYLDILKPPPSFITRPTGKLVLSTVGAVFLSLLYPLFQEYKAYVLEKEIAEKKLIEMRLKNKFLERCEIHYFHHFWWGRHVNNDW